MLFSSFRKHTINVLRPLTPKSRKQLDNIGGEEFSKGSATFILGRHSTAGGQKLRDLPGELSVYFS